jgi:hypothetical protein
MISVKYLNSDSPLTSILILPAANAANAVVQGGKAGKKKEDAVVVLVSPIDEEAEKVEQDFIRMERELLDLEQQFKY